MQTEMCTFFHRANSKLILINAGSFQIDYKNRLFKNKDIKFILKNDKFIEIHLLPKYIVHIF